MKKIITILLSLSILLGCSNDSNINKEKINLTIWHYYGGTTNQTFTYLINKFNQTVGIDEGIVVEARSFDSVSDLLDTVDTVSNEMDSSKMPNIFAGYVDNVVALDNRGFIADLSPYFTDKEIAEYYTPFINEGKIDGKLKIIPIAKSTELLHINKTIFDQFANETGHSYEELKTWEGILDISKSYYEWTDNFTKNIKNDGKSFFGIDSMANFMIVSTRQLGNEIFAADEEVIKHQFTEDIAKKIWDLFYVPYIKGYYLHNERYRSDDLREGNIVAYVGSTASSYYFPSQSINLSGENSNIECKIMKYPVYESGYSVAVQQGAGMAVTKSTEVQEIAATTFLKWFTEEENNIGFCVSTGYMPVKNNILDAKLILDEMARDGLIDDGIPMVESTRTAFEQLESYELYTSQAFDGSQNARKILEASLMSKIKSDLALRTNELENGLSYNYITSTLISNVNFKMWYNKITAELDHAINK